MNNPFDADILKLISILVSIIIIVYLFLRNKRNEDDPKCRMLHTYYISGFLIVIVVELVSYICVSNDNAANLINYISFASTLSSLLLSIVAIIYAIVSNNKGENQYAKIDSASDRISNSVEIFSTTSDNLTNDINSILSKLDELKKNVNRTNDFLLNSNTSSSENSIVTPTNNGTINVDSLIKVYINGGSFTGNLALLACVYSYETKIPVLTKHFIFEGNDNSNYVLGYIMASSALGVITIIYNDPQISVTACYPQIKDTLLQFLELYISKSKDDKIKKFNQNCLDQIKSLYSKTE